MKRKEILCTKLVYKSKIEHSLKQGVFALQFKDYLLFMHFIYIAFTITNMYAFTSCKHLIKIHYRLTISMSKNGI